MGRNKVTNIESNITIPAKSKNKKKKSKILLKVIIAILCVVILIAVILCGLYFYFDKKSTEILQATAPTLSGKMFVAEIENYYDEYDTDSDTDLQYNSVLLFSDVQDDNGIYTISAHYYITAYNDDGTASYANFTDCGDDNVYEDNPNGDVYYDITADLKGNVTINDAEYPIPIYEITIDENNNVIMLTDEEDVYELSDDESIKTDIDKFLKFKDRYNNLDTFMTSFLTSSYYGDTTWDDVIKEVFYDEPNVIVEPYDYENDDETLEGYKITISGNYCPNSVQLKGVASENGTLEIFVDSSNMDNIYLLSGKSVLNAFDVYISTGTNWYMYGF
jgi:hypothetical protein